MIERNKYICPKCRDEYYSVNPDGLCLKCSDGEKVLWFAWTSDGICMPFTAPSNWSKAKAVKAAENYYTGRKFVTVGKPPDVTSL